MVLAIAAFALAIAFFPIAATADETTSLTNTIAIEQLVDVAQTQRFLHESRCEKIYDPANPVAYTTVCYTPIVEADPLARPFVRLPTTALAAAAVLNFGLRELGEHVVRSRIILKGIALLYPLVLLHNAHQIHLAVTFKP